MVIGFKPSESREKAPNLVNLVNLATILDAPVVDCKELHMDAETKVYINNDLDIVMARMQARDLAKKMGFNTADQARFSLAASELARVLSWAPRKPGELVISNAARNGHQGLQVACLIQQEHISGDDNTNELSEVSVPRRSFVGACKLVDESSVDLQNDQQARVTLIKWLK